MTYNVAFDFVFNPICSIKYIVGHFYVYRRWRFITKRCSNLVHREVYSIQHYVTGRWFSHETPASSTNKTHRHDITKILLKVALNTITLIPFTTRFTILWFIVEYIAMYFFLWTKIYLIFLFLLNVTIGGCGKSCFVSSDHELYLKCTNVQEG